MIPSKKEFDELIRLATFDCLGPAVDLIWYPDEARIRGVIAGAAEVREDRFKVINKAKAYLWFESQAGFRDARKKIFPVRPSNWLDREVARVMHWAEKPIRRENDTRPDAIVAESLRRGITLRCWRLQWFEKWLSGVAECIREYHYPRLPNLVESEMREAISKAIKISDAYGAALQDVARFEECIDLPFPQRMKRLSEEVLRFRDRIADLLEQSRIAPFQRKDDTISIRHFVLRLGRKHARLFPGRNKPQFQQQAISHMLSMEGFPSKVLEERSVQEF